MVAIRTTSNMLEVPMCFHGQALVDESYVRFIVEQANKKFEDNARRTRGFFDRLRRELDGAIHSPTSTRWQHIPVVGVDAARPRRWSHSCTNIGQLAASSGDTLVVFGGFGGAGTQRRLGDVLAFHTQESTWTEVRACENATHGSPAPRMRHTAVSLGCRVGAPKSVVVFGGRASPAKAFHDVWELRVSASATGDKGVDGSWHALETTGDVPAGRWAHAACTSVHVPDTTAELPSMLVFGGRTNESVLGDLLCLEAPAHGVAEAWTWRTLDTVGTPPCARFAHTMTTDGRGLRAFVFGGYAAVAQWFDHSHDDSPNVCVVCVVCRYNRTVQLPDAPSNDDTHSGLQEWLLGDLHVLDVGTCGSYVLHSPFARWRK